MLEFVDERRGIVNIIEYGIHNDVGGLLKHIITPDFSVQRRKPFLRAPNVDIDQFWCTCQEFLASHAGVIMFCTSGYHEHWTIGCRISNKTLTLFDSSGLKRLPRRYCCTSSSTAEARHIIYPTSTYFLWIDDE